LSLQAQVFQSIAGHEIPVANLSDPTSETALAYRDLIQVAIINDSTFQVREEAPQIPSSWHTSLCCTAATVLDTLLHRIACPPPSLAGLSRLQLPRTLALPLPPIVQTLAAIHWHLTTSSGSMRGATARGSLLKT
jgi:hypothetical protein